MPGKWVFPARQGEGHIGQHQRLWEKVVERAKLDEKHIGRSVVLYDLRHTFATRAIERCVLPGELMRILGHANLRTIMRYVHMTDAHADAGMRTFEKGRTDNARKLDEADSAEEPNLSVQ